MSVVEQKRKRTSAQTASSCLHVCDSPLPIQVLLLLLLLTRADGRIPALESRQDDSSQLPQSKNHKVSNDVHDGDDGPAV